MRNRTFESPVWGHQTLVLNMSSASYVGTTGTAGSVTNTGNVGGKDSTTYMTWVFSTNQSVDSGFELKFPEISNTDIPANAFIDSVKVDYTYSYSGSFGNGQAQGHFHVLDSSKNEMHEGEKITNRDISKKTVSYEGTPADWNRDNISTIWVTMDGSVKKANRPTINFYGATLTIVYHMRAIE